MLNLTSVTNYRLNRRSLRTRHDSIIIVVDNSLKSIVRLSVLTLYKNSIRFAQVDLKDKIARNDFAGRHMNHQYIELITIFHLVILVKWQND